MDRAQAVAATAPQQAEEYGLGLVGARVSGRDDVDGPGLQQFAEVPVAAPTAMLFDIAPCQPGLRRDVVATDEHGDRKACREAADKLLVEIGFGSAERVG